MRKHGLKVLMMAVMAVMGLMAFSASSALAATNLNVIDEANGEPGFFLTENGTTNPNPTLLNTETVGATGGEGRLLLPAKSAEIDCATAKLATGAFIENEYEDFLLPGMKKGGHGKGEALFENCKVFSATKDVKGAELTACTNTLNGTTSPHSISAKGLLRVVRHEGSTYIIVEPEINSKANAEANKALTSAFTTITFSGTCSLPATINITGGIAVKAPATDAKEPALSVKTWELSGTTLKRTVEQELLGPILKFGANEAFIENTTVKAKLTGPNAEKIWGAM